ncbi:hypothetical protein CAEBREN_30103 [Caenorhabditis brenneri]|uniref:Uncharacterized protein n=1 Tax=Caenorhabditis brenneri TaxID=135651 RepID=G0NJP8_CAEBE|nr:hypothetical protein CAEBREN_30103 [Caenorhabditis brenneri]
MSSPCRSMFRELLTTRWRTDISEEDEIETVRAGYSALQPNRSTNEENIIEGREENVELVDDENYQIFHRNEETPKLIQKRTSCVTRDEASNVLRTLMSTPKENLIAERCDLFSQKWFHSTRDTEKKLIEYIFLNPNNRPYFFTMQSRNIQIEDIGDLILKSLLSEPRETGQCLARIAIKTPTDMPFTVLLDVLVKLGAENDGFQLSDSAVTAKLIDTIDFEDITHKLMTEELRKYGYLEHKLDSEGHRISSCASITCSIRGKRHVEMRIVYTNRPTRRNISRNRYIELEQTVRSMDRRVVIVEERKEVVEYENDADMIPLKEGLEPVKNLISYLETGDLGEN